MLGLSLSNHSPTPQPSERQRPSCRRCHIPPPFQLTHRDQQIILRVAYYRLLTTHHIEALLFHTPTANRSLKTQCQRRLQLLYHHRFLNRIQQPFFLGEGRKPFIYTLDKQGANVVNQLLGTCTSAVNWNPRRKDRTDPYRLQHDLGISDTWVVLDRLLQVQKMLMPHWMTQWHLKSPKLQSKLPNLTLSGQKRSKVPDGYFALQFPENSSLAHCFYEEDRGTETKKQWTEKVCAYLNFKSSGASHTHFGCRNFRVLTKTTTSKRLDNLKQWTEQAGGNAMFWFITQDKINIWEPDTFLEPIWDIAAAQGTYPLSLTDVSQLQLTDF